MCSFCTSLIFSVKWRELEVGFMGYSSSIIVNGTIRKLGHGFLFAFLWVIQVHCEWYHSKAWTRFPIRILMAVSCIVSEIKRYIVRKSHFSYPQHLTPPLGGFPSECCHTVWCGKTRMVWLPDGEKSLMICLAVSTEYRRVTDRRTEQTSFDSIVPAVHSIAR